MAIPSDLNWLAVGLGTLLGFLLGWLWYGPVFGRVWASGSGMAEVDRSAIPLRAMGLQVLGLFCLALVIGVTATTDALGTAILAIVAASVLMMASGSFTLKSMPATLIDGGYVIVAGMLMIAAQGVL